MQRRGSSTGACAGGARGEPDADLTGRQNGARHADRFCRVPVDFAALLDPARCVLVTQECQNGVIGEQSVLPQLAAAAAPIRPRLGILAEAARAAGVPVVHCVAARRPDGLGANTNARLFHGVAKAPVPLTVGSAAAQVIDELGPEDGDFTITRLHGLGPMSGTDLDAILRNLGVTTIVGVGVSVNIGMTNFVMDAVNLGYQFVLPRDAVAGLPADYAEAVIDHTLSLLATITSTGEVAGYWDVHGSTTEKER